MFYEYEYFIGPLQPIGCPYAAVLLFSLYCYFGYWSFFRDCFRRHYIRNCWSKIVWKTGNPPTDNLQLECVFVFQLPIDDFRVRKHDRRPYLL